MYPRTGLGAARPKSGGSGPGARPVSWKESGQDQEDKENVNSDVDGRNRSWTAARRGAGAAHKTTASNGENKHPPPPPTLREALDTANTAILGETTGLLALSVEDVDGTILTPALLRAGLRLGEDGAVADQDMRYLLWVALRDAVSQRHEYPPSSSGQASLEGLENRASARSLLQDALERLIVEVGLAQHGRAPGPHMTFVDPRRHSNAGALVRSARRLVALFGERGVAAKDLVVSIPATEAGVAAARRLQGEGTHVNLILVAGLTHAAVCAEVRASVISIAVGALLESHERSCGAYKDPSQNPGVESILATVEYYKLHAIQTKVVGGDFRELAEVRALPGLDAVCLSKTQLERARWDRDRGAGGSALRWLPTPPAHLERTTPHLRAIDVGDNHINGKAVSRNSVHAAACMRARQAQYPTAFLEPQQEDEEPSGGHGPEINFMARMSAGARGALAAAVCPPLRRMERAMDAVEERVRAEVGWQLAMATLSLDALYTLRDARRVGVPPETRNSKKRREVDTRQSSHSDGDSEEYVRMPLSKNEHEHDSEDGGGLVEDEEYF